MRFHKNVIALFSGIGIALLILDSKTALAGALDGIQLCINTLIPSLFPFIILSSFLVKSLEGRNFRFLKGINKFCGIPSGLGSIFLIGLIGGYPIGAKMIADAYKHNSISKKDAQHMLGFCSNAGPAFLFGVISPQFSNPAIPWIIWGIHILSAVLVGNVLCNHSNYAQPIKLQQSFSPSEIISSGIKAAAIISAWVILFRILIFWLQRWLLFHLPAEFQVAFIGFVELTNGIIALKEITSIPIRIALCTAMLSWGGLCVLMQTYSVVSPLGIGKYLPGKVLQTGISLLLCIGIFSHPLLITVVSVVLYAIYRLILQKNSRFSKVNTV